jgi:hypothetical protein
MNVLVVVGSKPGLSALGRNQRLDDEIAIAMYARIDSVVWILPGMPP